MYGLRSIPTGRHYIGSTADLAGRLDEHNTRTGRWTSAFKPWGIVDTEEFETRRKACNSEAFLEGRQGISERLRLIGRLRS